MILRILTAALISLALVACGVKTNLELPSGKEPDRWQVDSFKPPQLLGQ